MKISLYAIPGINRELMKNETNKNAGDKTKIDIISPEISRLIKIVCEICDVDYITVKSESRIDNAVMARHLIHWYMMVHLHKKDWQASALTNRNRATAISSKKKVMGWIETNDQETIRLISEMNKRI